MTLGPISGSIPLRYDSYIVKTECDQDSHWCDKRTKTTKEEFPNSSSEKEVLSTLAKSNIVDETEAIKFDEETESLIQHYMKLRNMSRDGAIAFVKNHLMY